MSARTAVLKTASTPELSRQTIVERALELADSESLASVSIRRLAAEFQVTPMALYWHIKNKNELLAAMGDDFYDHIRLDDLGTGPWLDRLDVILSRLIDSLRRHPASVGLAVAQVLHCDRGRQLTEAALQSLRDAGFSTSQCADLARTALQTAVTVVAGQPGAEFDTPAEERDAVLAAKRVAIMMLPDETFPCLRASVDALTGCEDIDSYFKFATELFLAGVEALQARLVS
jgi:TetR/AcrR family tetracycline transcriptional repressor